MIRSEQEYRVAVQKLEENRQAVAQTRSNLVQQGLSEDVVNLALGSLVAIGQQLADEIATYERTLRFDFDTVPFAGIGPLLVKLRIARRLSQSELADLLATDKGNVSRDEKNDYASITRDRIERILEALRFELLLTPVPLEKLQTQPVGQPAAGYLAGSFASSVSLGAQQTPAPIVSEQPITVTINTIDWSYPGNPAGASVQGSLPAGVRDTNVGAPPGGLANHSWDYHQGMAA